MRPQPSRFDRDLGVCRQCSVCRDFFPATAEFFYRQSRVKTGWRLMAWCKACTVLRQREARRRKEAQEST